VITHRKFIEVYVCQKNPKIVIKNEVLTKLLQNKMVQFFLPHLVQWSLTFYSYIVV